MTRRHSRTEENYLKTIYHLGVRNPNGVGIKTISEKLELKSPTVTNMVKKLAEKGLVNYKKYYAVTLTKKGESHALKVIRKHRLWETFLVKNLNFSWGEVHEIAEQLEHIQSPKLIKKLDEALGFPKFDPHGDPIPDENGKIHERHNVKLSELALAESGVIAGVIDHGAGFLQFLDKQKLSLGTKVTVKSKFDFDNSLILVNHECKEEVTLSAMASSNILIAK